MTQNLILLPIALIGAWFLALLLRSRTAGTARRGARAQYLDGCRGLFGAVKSGVSPHGYQRLNGTYRGHLFDIQALPDTLTYRKLPSLWLLVTIPTPTGLTATTDLMARANGGEVFSKFGQLPVQIVTPSGFPDDVVVRTDDPGALPGPEVVDLLRLAFRAERLKELVLAPEGLRLVWLAEEADRTRYLIFRDSEMGAVPLAPEELSPLLDRLATLADLIEMKEVH